MVDAGKQRLSGIAVTRKDCYADTGRDACRMPMNNHGITLHYLQYLFRNRLRPTGAEVGENNGKFIAAQPCDGIGVT